MEKTKSRPRTIISFLVIEKYENIMHTDKKKTCFERVTLVFSSPCSVIGVERRSGKKIRRLPVRGRTGSMPVSGTN